MTDRPDHAFSLRHATADDQPRIAKVVDDWFAGQRVRHLVGRAWFRHFGSTSWVASDDAGAPIGFLIGYRSQDLPGEAVVHLVGVHPGHRRHRVGRSLVNGFLVEAADAGASTMTAVVWPGEPSAIAFFRALGFSPDDGPGSQSLYGTPAFADYDGDGEDRAVLVRRFAAPPG